MILFSLAPPEITFVPDPSTFVRSFPSYRLAWSATGVLPINTALIRNSTVLFNTSTTGGTFKLDKEGNYTFLANNKYGTGVEEFSVVFAGETIFWHLKSKVIILRYSELRKSQISNQKANVCLITCFSQAVRLSH